MHKSHYILRWSTKKWKQIVFILRDLNNLGANVNCSHTQQSAVEMTVFDSGGVDYYVCMCACDCVLRYQ